MKHKKLILSLAIIIIFLLYVGFPYMEKTKTEDQSYLNKDIIRFHVRANSDRKIDQSLKLQVRDIVLDLMKERLKDVKSVEESRLIIKNSVDDIEHISKNLVTEMGFDYGISANLRKEVFPLRKYGKLVFPQGEYESLTLEIGEAKGENWWCVMFPPLCFVDITHSVAVENPDGDEDLNEYMLDETQPFKFKSIIFDWIRSMW